MLDTNLSQTNPAAPVLDKLIQISLFAFAAFSMFSISITQISFTLGALSWLLKTHLTQTWKEMKGTLVGIAILGFCLACILAVITSVDLESSLKHLKKLLQFIIFFWVANTVQSEKQRGLLVGLVVVAGVVAALNGLSPLWNIDSDSGLVRLEGTMSKPTTFSGVLMLTGLVALARFLFGKPKEYWVLGSAGIITLCLLLSLTRQAWLGFLVGTIFLMFFWNKKYLLLVPPLLVGLLLFAPENISNRMHTFTNLKDGSLQARVFVWKGGWKIFKDHPITGCGFKCVDSVYAQYPDPSGRIRQYRGMHSNIFQLLVDTGIIGLSSWAFIWLAYFIETFKRWRIIAKEPSHETSKSILIGSSVAVLAFLVGGFFETSVYDSEVAMLLYFFMGISSAKVKESPIPVKI